MRRACIVASILAVPAVACAVPMQTTPGISVGYDLWTTLSPETALGADLYLAQGNVAASWDGSSLPHRAATAMDYQQPPFSPEMNVTPTTLTAWRASSLQSYADADTGKLGLSAMNTIHCTAGSQVSIAGSSDLIVWSMITDNITVNQEVTLKIHGNLHGSLRATDSDPDYQLCRATLDYAAQFYLGGGEGGWWDGISSDTLAWDEDIDLGEPYVQEITLQPGTYPFRVYLEAEVKLDSWGGLVPSAGSIDAMNTATYWLEMPDQPGLSVVSQTGLVPVLVPEPTGIALGLLGTLTLLRRRRAA